MGVIKFKVVLLSILLILLLWFSRGILSSTLGLVQSFSVQVVGQVLSPIVELKKNISQQVSRYFSALEFYDASPALYLELENLKIQHQILNTRVEEVTHLQTQQNNFLLYNVVPLKVVGDDPLVFGQSLWVKGKLELNTPVLTANGLVGRVDRIWGKMARVQLVTDKNFYVDLLNVRTGKRVLAQALAFKALGDELTGDVLVTSGLGDIYPKNLVVGQIKVNGGARVLIESAALPLNANYLFALLPKK